MSFTKVVVVLGLLCCALLLGAEQSATAPVFAGPMLWSMPVEAFSVSGGEPPFLRSMFVPETEIVVTRIEAFDENGPRLNLSSVTGQPVPCSPIPSSGTLQNMRVLSGSTGAVVTVLVNGQPTSITCTVAGTGAFVPGSSCQDNTHSQPVSAGDLVAIQAATAVASSIQEMQVSLEKQ